MADVLPGFTFDRGVARYRDTSTGRFVSRDRGANSIMRLLDQRIRSSEQRLGDIVQAIADKSMAPGVGQMLMRDELRRLHLQNAALGAGGVDRLTFREFGRAGRALRDTYPRVANLVQGLNNGTVSIDQAMNRITGYVGEARVNFLHAERDAAHNTGLPHEERRLLGVAEHCVDCVGYAAQGWQPMGTLPVPGERSRCNGRCRCRMERRLVTPEMQQERNTARLERMMATP